MFIPHHQNTGKVKYDNLSKQAKFKYSKKKIKN
jgi:hypothetical protein